MPAVSGTEPPGVPLRPMGGAVPDVDRRSGALRSELAPLRQSVETSKTTPGDAEGVLQRAAAEFRILPDSSDDAFRWGFLGAWGRAGPQGASHSFISVHTTTIDSFLETRSEVAKFAAVFADPATLRICRCVFRHGGRVAKQEIASSCDLDDDAFVRAVRPLLEWHFVEWKGDWVEACSQGVNCAITLTSMAIEGYKQ